LVVEGGYEMLRVPKMKYNVKTKLLVGFFCISLFSSVVVGVFTFVTIRDSEVRSLKGKLEMVAQMAPGIIDAEAHSKLQPGDESKAEYTGMLTRLREYKKISGLTYLYTLAPPDGERLNPGDVTVRFVLDTDETEGQAPIGKEYELQKEMVVAFEGTPSITDEAYTDEWGTFYTGFAPLRNAQGEVVAIVGADLSLAEVEAVQAKLLSLALLGMSVSLVLSVITALLYVRSVVRPVDRLHDAVKRFSEKDFSARAEVISEDEIGDLSRSFNTMADMIQDYHHRAEEEVRERTQDLVALSASVEETSRGLAETTSMVKETTNKTRKAALLASETKKASERGNSEMGEMSGFVSRMGESSGEIGRIIKVIQEIAFQTNLLSLNAAVEAARAGDAGRGFAVVAQEVRSLAQRSSEAARDTSEIITNNVRLSEKGITAAQRVEKALAAINVNANQVNQLMEEVDRASAEESAAIQRISGIISQMGKSHDSLSQGEESLLGL
jgi:methyl-accepting chemotaxis protein